MFYEETPTSRWVDFKTTHQLDGYTQTPHTNAWGKNRKPKEFLE